MSLARDGMQTILVVEDNAITRRTVRATLERAGYAVVEAADGATALRVAEESRPALILQDLILPDVDGFDLALRLRQRPGGADAAVVAFSGFVSKLDEARMSAAGFDDVVTKPVGSARLVQIIEANLPSPASVHDPAIAAAATPRRLLVVDDDPVQRKLARFRLARLGFTIDEAGDGIEALERARAVVPDAVVSDVMMPRLDGFGLAVALRQDPALAHVPLVLVTSNYVEPSDRDLARRAGAHDLVCRTPNLESLEAALLEAARGRRPVLPAGVVVAPDLERELSRRVVQQLERQVLLNAGVAQRCSSLAAELTVLASISEALLRMGDIDTALDDVLASCLDAGGLAAGVLYLLSPEGDMRVLTVGTAAQWDTGRLNTFFGRPDELHRIMVAGAPVLVPSTQLPTELGDELLNRTEATSALIAPVVQAGVPLGALLVAAHGREIDADVRAFVRGVAGQIAQALALARAFDERRDHERLATDQAAMLRLIIDSLAEGVVVVDRTGRPLLSNAAAESLTVLLEDRRSDDWALRAGVFRGDQVTPLATEDHPLVRALRGERVDQVELFLRPPGQARGRWLTVSARPMIAPGGELRGAVAVFRDVTEHRQTEASLMVADRMASVGTLAAGVAHEINNPLASVMANLDLAIRDVADLVKRGLAPPDLADELHDAREGADRVRQIVRDLKIFSRPQDEQRGPIDVRRVLESTLRMAWNEIRHRARLIRDYGDVPPVQGNESRLGQVFLNLVVNAAHAIPEGRAPANEIKIATRTANGHVIVEVSDSGSGIPPEILSRLFTPFFTTKPIGVGTGLGLSICQRIVSSLGGEIQVDSQLGRGSTFRVILPAAGSVPAQPGVAPVVPDLVRRGRVLVVDDEPLIGTVVRRTLMSIHDVTVAASTRDALDRIVRGERFDVILCDLMMPQLTGMDLHAELERLAPDQARRMIFMTGGAFTPRARAFLDNHPARHLEKPFETDQLKALIAERIQ